MTLVKLNNRRLPGTFDAIFNDFFSSVPSLWQQHEPLRVPPVNISETNDGYQLELIAPGLNKEEFAVNVENGLLTIAWEKKEQKEEQSENAKTLRREYAYRSFKRSFSVDETIDTENIDAKYENGVLRIHLPKVEPAKAGSRQIAIQ